MSLRTQFIKSTLCVILYIAVCTLLLKIRQQLYSVSFLKSNQSAENCSVVSQAITKPIGLETKLLEYDEMQESLLLLQQISNTCNKYNLKTPLIRRHFLYNSKQQSIYCWIRKAASTSFTKLFSDMKNRRVMRNYYREVDILAPETLKELYYIANDPKVFKLLIVRHPFQRLVSSYRDRIEDNSKHTAQAWMYTKQIFHLTRPALFHSNITTGNFQQKVFTTDKRLKLVPTFKEFLLWLLQSSDQDDVHWDRYNTHCGVCNIRYSYILKLDDYTYDQITYIFSKFRLDKNKVYLSQLEQTRGGHTNFDTTCKYFANLTQDIILRLYGRYKIDFEMFNYNLNQYLFCANKTF